MPRDSVSRLAPEPDVTVSSERALAVLWSRSHSLAEGLLTEEGRCLRVVYPGRPSSRAGPDFLDAVITTEDGRTLKGDVEIHLNAPDWYSHRHHSDPNYNGVVLHVVLRPKGGTSSRQESGATAPVASIADVVPLLERQEAPNASIPAVLTGTDGHAIEGALDRAGDERFLDKSRGFGLELGEGDPDQTLYSALMDAAGYSSNRKPFRDLAKRVPLSLLCSLQREPPTTRLLSMEAMLIGGAGLISYLRSPEEEARVRALRRYLPKTRPIPTADWNLFRVRPANHPVVRIKGMACLVDRYVEDGLLRGLVAEVMANSAGRLLNRMTLRPFIGKGRAGDMIVNVVLPMLHAYGGVSKSRQLRSACADLYRSFPKLAENEITREMRRLLPQERVAGVVTNARRQQGLMRLYRGVAGGRSFGHPVGLREIAP